MQLSVWHTKYCFPPHVLQGMGELVSIFIFRLSKWVEQLKDRFLNKPCCDPMFPASGTRLMWGVCIQQCGLMRSLQRSPRKRNLSSSTCPDHQRTVWATKTVSYSHTVLCVCLCILVQSRSSLYFKNKWSLQHSFLAIFTESDLDLTQNVFDSSFVHALPLHQISSNLAWCILHTSNKYRLCVLHKFPW